MAQLPQKNHRMDSKNVRVDSDHPRPTAASPRKQGVRVIRRSWSDSTTRFYTNPKDDDFVIIHMDASILHRRIPFIGMLNFLTLHPPKDKWILPNAERGRIIRSKCSIDNEMLELIEVTCCKYDKKPVKIPAAVRIEECNSYLFDFLAHTFVKKIEIKILLSPRYLDKRDEYLCRFISFS